MKQFIDFVPILAFVLGYVVGDIFIATAALMVASVAQVIVFKIARWEISRQMWIILAIALVAGALTLIFRDKAFIQWKPTIVFWGVGGALLLSRAFGQGDLIKKMMANVLELPDRAWRVLTFIWGGSYIAAGFANLYVAYAFTEETWVAYKLISGFGLPIALLVASGVYLSKTGQLPTEDLAPPSEREADA